MATIQHANITDPKIHEPKGVSAATTGQVYLSDGVGSGTWTTLTLDALTNVTVPTPTTGQVLTYNGSAWVNSDLPASAGVEDLTDLNDVTITTPSNGQVLVYNGTQWVNDTISGGGAGYTDTATQPTPYTEISNGIRGTISVGTSINGADVKDAAFVIEKWIDQDYDTGAGNRFDRGALYLGVNKITGTSFGVGMTAYYNHTGGEGQVIAIHGRAQSSHVDGKIFAGWGYINSSAHAGAVCWEFNMNNDHTDIGWSSNGLGVGYMGGIIITTADSCTSPITWYQYMAAQKSSAVLAASTVVTLTSGSPATITKHPEWVTATSYTTGDIVRYGNNVYVAASTGTSGATAPVHTSGTVSDGTVTWTYDNTKGFLDPTSASTTLSGAAGRYIRISGASTAGNNKIVKVASVTNSTITLDAAETLVSDVAGPAITLRVWVCRGAYTGFLMKSDAIEKMNASGDAEWMRIEGASDPEYAYKGIRFYSSTATYMKTGIEFNAMNFTGPAIHFAKGQSLGWGGLVSTASASCLLYVDVANDRLTYTGGALEATFPDGDATTPAVRFLLDSNTGMYRIGADKIGFSTGGFAAVEINGASDFVSNADAMYHKDRNASFLGSGEMQTLRHTTSTNATPGNLDVWALAEDEVAIVEVKAVGKVATGAEVAAFHQKAIFHRPTGGNVTDLGDIVAAVNFNNIAAGDTTLDIVANTGTQNVAVNITGILATTIKWEIVTKITLLKD